MQNPSPPTVQPVGASKTEDDLLGALRKLCDGLLFPSESDRAVEPFLWTRADLEAGGDTPGPAGKPEPVSALTLLAANKAPDDAKIEQQTADDFLRTVLDEQDYWEQTERDRAARFHALYNALKAQVSGPTAFRVGEIDIDAYLLGRTPTGDVAGVHTQLVET